MEEKSESASPTSKNRLSRGFYRRGSPIVRKTSFSSTDDDADDGSAQVAAARPSVAFVAARAAAEATAAGPASSSQESGGYRMHSLAAKPAAPAAEAGEVLSPVRRRTLRALTSISAFNKPTSHKVDFTHRDSGESGGSACVCGGQAVIEELRRKVERAVGQMTSLRDSYYKELFHLREQMHRQEEASKGNNSEFQLTEEFFFDPSEYASCKEVEDLVAQKVSIMQKELDSKVRMANAQAFREAESLRKMLVQTEEKLSDAQEKLRTSEELVARKSKLVKQRDTAHAKDPSNLASLLSNVEHRGSIEEIEHPDDDEGDTRRSLDCAVPNDDSEMIEDPPVEVTRRNRRAKTLGAKSTSFRCISKAELKRASTTRKLNRQSTFEQKRHTVKNVEPPKPPVLENVLAPEPVQKKEEDPVESPKLDEPQEPEVASSPLRVPETTQEAKHTADQGTQCERRVQTQHDAVQSEIKGRCIDEIAKRLAKAGQANQLRGLGIDAARLEAVILACVELLDKDPLPDVTMLPYPPRALGTNIGTQTEEGRLVPHSFSIEDIRPEDELLNRSDSVELEEPSALSAVARGHRALLGRGAGRGRGPQLVERLVESHGLGVISPQGRAETPTTPRAVSSTAKPSTPRAGARPPNSFSRSSSTTFGCAGTSALPTLEEAALQGQEAVAPYSLDISPQASQTAKSKHNVDLMTVIRSKLQRERLYKAQQTMEEQEAKRLRSASDGDWFARSYDEDSDKMRPLSVQEQRPATQGAGSESPRLPARRTPPQAQVQAQAAAPTAAVTAPQAPAGPAAGGARQARRRAGGNSAGADGRPQTEGGASTCSSQSFGLPVVPASSTSRPCTSPSSPSARQLVSPSWRDRANAAKHEMTTSPSASSRAPVVWSSAATTTSWNQKVAFFNFDGSSLAGAGEGVEPRFAEPGREDRRFLMF
eukprot:TRINITY_DN37082_c0_g1_i1.p1 TRINITY_DN37082_c0_g1~~TRINITY_DN37082_c0_g1_i1.p1  ORF type:complete len:936 (-),score=181.95 TRINITY_DN37082_c0_g1_i1:67-2874(-)